MSKTGSLPALSKMISIAKPHFIIAYFSFRVKETNMDNNRLWGRIIRHHRIEKSETVEIEDDNLEEAFLELCRRFDVQRPIQLPKHNREFEKFGRTFYSREHFTESVDFEKLEIELIMPDGKKKSSGVRSPLMDA